MIYLFLLCLTQVESAVDSDSVGVFTVTELNVRRILNSVARAEPDPRFDVPSDHRFHAKSILSRLARSPHSRDGSTRLYLPHLRQFLQEFLDSAWDYPPISKYLTTVVIPGMVINHGKVADLGRLSLVSVTHQFVNGAYQTNLTVFHENLKTTYKYNLDGPKGRLEVSAPSRIYSIHFCSKQEGPQCVTDIRYLALDKEDELEFFAHGESSDDVNPHIKFVEHVLTLESRRTAFFNIEAAVRKKLQTAIPLFCQDI